MTIHTQNITAKACCETNARCARWAKAPPKSLEGEKAAPLEAAPPKKGEEESSTNQKEEGGPPRYLT